jgi:hypothetical protein
MIKILVNLHPMQTQGSPLLLTNVHQLIQSGKIPLAFPSAQLSLGAEELLLFL